MSKWIVPAMILAVIVSSCSSKQEYKKSKDGVLYKIFPGKGKDSMKQGDIFRMRMMESYEDSALSVAEELSDQFMRADTAGGGQMPVLSVIMELKVGDSVVFAYPIDSIIKKNNGTAPYPWMKPGKTIYLGARLLKKYKSEAEARGEYDMEMSRMQLVMAKKDSLNKIKADAELAKAVTEYKDAVKTTGGTYVKIIKQGDGPQCDSGKVVNIRYEGRLTNGTVFDGNMKPMSNGTAKPPFEFQLGVYPVIRGWFEGLQQLKKGAKAQFYIPWASAYGQQGNQGIPPYSNLIFDIEVADVKDATAANTNPVVPAPPK